jgi:hypothetical protein
MTGRLRQIKRIYMITLGLCGVITPCAAWAAPSPLIDIDCTYKGGARDGQHVLVIVQDSTHIALMDMAGLAAGGPPQISHSTDWSTLMANAPTFGTPLPSTQDLFFVDGGILQQNYATADTKIDPENRKYLDAWLTDPAFKDNLTTVEDVKYDKDFITFGFISILKTNPQKLFDWNSREKNHFVKEKLVLPSGASSQLSWLSANVTVLQQKYKSWKEETSDELKIDPLPTAPTIIFGPRLTYEIDLLTGEFEFDYDGTRAVGSCAQYARKIPAPPKP